MENKQLSEKELKKVQGLYKSTKDTILTLGELEMQYNKQKLMIFDKYAELERKLSDALADIEKEYGKVNLDLTTGELLPIEEQEE